VRHSFAVQQCFKAGSLLREDHSGSKITRKIFGKAPWHRKGSGDSLSSVASSVRELLKSGTPPASPISDRTMNGLSDLFPPHTHAAG
jgi:hypothetical protein